MGARLHSWWQQIKQYWIAIGGIAIILIGVLAFIFAGYWFRWSWTGFLSKTLWDWLQLLIIPAVLAIGGFWFNQIQKDREEKASAQRTRIEREAAEQRAQIDREIALDDQRATLLQAYLDRMSELLLTHQLRGSASTFEARSIASARTLTVLTGLDGSRKGSVIKFLYETSLIKAETGSRIIDLNAAYLHEADLRYTILEHADLSSTRLRWADLRYARLTNANLSYAHLRGANMSQTILRGANLRSARFINVDLSHADLRGADLKEANLSGATLQGAKYNSVVMQVKGAQGNSLTLEPTQWPEGFDYEGAGAICDDHPSIGRDITLPEGSKDP